MQAIFMVAVAVVTNKQLAEDSEVMQCNMNGPTACMNEHMPEDVMVIHLRSLFVCVLFPSVVFLTFFWGEGFAGHGESGL